MALALAFSACARQAPAPAPVPLPLPGVESAHYTATPSPSPSPEPTLTPTYNPLLALSPVPSPTATPDPFTGGTIAELQARTYGGGVLEDLGALPSPSTRYTRRLFRYRSEGLNLYGFIALPRGEGPFPVVFMFHGHIDPADYTTLDYSARYADALAEAGYVVLHPNLRGYAPSPDAENSLGIGDSIDALNLIALVRQQAGTDGLLNNADGQRLGLWGHSMGGGIVMRILAVDKDIDAAVLYASIHASESFNLAHFTEDGRGNPKPNVPAEALARLSPLEALADVEVPISIHHGVKDMVVPVEWSRFLCDYLKEANREVECTEYPNQPHTFQNSGDTEFIANMIRFFDAHLKAH